MFICYLKTTGERNLNWNEKRDKHEKCRYNRKMIKGNFPKERKTQKKILGKIVSAYLALYLPVKNQEKLKKSKSPVFLSSFWPKFAHNFFSKIEFRHILGITILHLCAKNQKKLMSRSRERLVTDGRMDGQRLINRTSR